MSSINSTRKNEKQLIQAEIIISWVLRIGVMLCGAIISLGIVAKFISVESSQQLISDLMSGQTHIDFAATASPLTILTGIAHFNADSIIIAGLLLLIALPILRVALTVILFFHERDWPFMGITLFVLTVLLSGIFLGKGL